MIPTNVTAQMPATSKLIDSTARDSVILAWVKNLYEEGVTLSDDSLFVNEETSRLLTDQAYREIMYPSVYTWEMVKYFINRQDLKKAYWFMMNLYLVDDSANKNKEMVVRSLLMYDRLFKVDKILVNTFYTYIFTDPEIGTIADGHSNVTAPHMMDKKLNALKEILFYLDKYKPEGRKDEPGKNKTN